MVQFERHKIYVNSKPVIWKSHLNTQIQMKFWLNEFERFNLPTGVCVKKKPCPGVILSTGWGH